LQEWDARTVQSHLGVQNVLAVLCHPRSEASRVPCLWQSSSETERGFDADRRLWSQEAQVRADLIVQQLRDLGVAEEPQPSGKLGGYQQCRCESLRWIA